MAKIVDVTQRPDQTLDAVVQIADGSTHKVSVNAPTTPEGYMTTLSGDALTDHWQAGLAAEIAKLEAPKPKPETDHAVLLGLTIGDDVPDENDG